MCDILELLLLVTFNILHYYKILTLYCISQVLPAPPPSNMDSVSQPLSVRSCNVESTMFYDYFNYAFIKLIFVHKKYSPDFRGFTPQGFPDNVNSERKSSPMVEDVKFCWGDVFIGRWQLTRSDFKHSKLFQS